MTKVIGYLLNDDHQTGRAKAAFFAAFGFDRTSPLTLALSLDRHGAERPIVTTSSNAFGRKYQVRCALRSPDGRDPCIVTIWFQAEGEHSCRLVTAYPADLAGPAVRP